MGERSFDGDSSWTVGRLDTLRATAVTVRAFAHAANGTLRAKEGICRNNDQLMAVKKGLVAFEGVYSAIEAALAECRVSADTPLGSALAALAAAAGRWSSDDSFDGSLQACGDLVEAASRLRQVHFANLVDGPTVRGLVQFGRRPNSLRLLGFGVQLDGF